jgi:trigger factor
MLEAVTEVSGPERVKPEKLLERLRKNGRLDSLKDDLSQRKAWDLVADSAKPVPATASES